LLPNAGESRHCRLPSGVFAAAAGDSSLSPNRHNFPNPTTGLRASLLVFSAAAHRMVYSYVAKLSRAKATILRPAQIPNLPVSHVPQGSPLCAFSMHCWFLSRFSPRSC
jgi:hypothetical protein